MTKEKDGKEKSGKKAPAKIDNPEHTHPKNPERIVP